MTKIQGSTPGTQKQRSDTITDKRRLTPSPATEPKGRATGETLARTGLLITTDKSAAGNEKTEPTESELEAAFLAELMQASDFTSSSNTAKLAKSFQDDPYSHRVGEYRAAGQRVETELTVKDFQESGKAYLQENFGIEAGTEFSNLSSKQVQQINAAYQAHCNASKEELEASLPQNGNINIDQDPMYEMARNPEAAKLEFNNYLLRMIVDQNPQI